MAEGTVETEVVPEAKGVARLLEWRLHRLSSASILHLLRAHTIGLGCIPKQNHPNSNCYGGSADHQSRHIENGHYWSLDQRHESQLTPAH